MIVVEDAIAASDLPQGTVVTIGNYDGIHRGQRQVIDRVVARARELSLSSVVVTFDPHPLTVLRPDAAPSLLTTAAQKVALLEELGVDYLLWVRFTAELAETSARSFVHDFLHRGLGVRELLVGESFTFGHGREGNIALLREMGSTLGFSVLAVEELRVGGAAASSTRIRAALKEGKVAEATELLGRPYAIVGSIARGDRMGQRLGWPTINLAPENDLLPADGVYATRVYFPSFPATFDSATNIGTRPTVYENYERVVESHILDFSSDVYGERVELRFFKRLREEKMFQSTVDLSDQIRRDVEGSREYFSARRRLEERVPEYEEPTLPQ